MAASNPAATVEIDFVSDVACPWCAVGLAGLQKALAEIGPSLSVRLRFQPFELNPQMGAEGQDAAEHLAAKYGMGPEQLREARTRIAQRGAEVGFAFSEKRDRVWNTFNAHRLLHWAAEEGDAQQLALKRELLAAYHARNESPASYAVLVSCAMAAGLDAERAKAILQSDEYSAEVRKAQRQWLDAGIQSVPAVVINRRHLVSGGQPPHVFASALRQVAGLGGGSPD